MPAPLAGPGQGLQLPQNLYPSELFNAPLDTSNNRVTLAPGNAIVLPAGDWYVSALYSVVEYLDPVTNTWVRGPACAWNGGVAFAKSDGFNCRVANWTGCPVSASIANAGSGYVQATTTVVANIGGSTWQPIVGGAVSATVSAAGAGYGAPPLVLIPAPPPGGNNPNGVGGVQASGYAVIASGTVSTVSLTNPGAGYPSTVTVTLVPSPFDPNLNTGITLASIILIPYASGSITGVLCTNNGNALASNQFASLTLTVSGAGASATLSPNIMQSLLTSTVSGSGAPAGALGATTYGGAPSQGTITNNPDFNYLAFRPRQAQITFASITAGAVGQVIDGGLFESQPTVAPVSTAIFTTAATLANTFGGRPDIVGLQPAP